MNIESIYKFSKNFLQIVKCAETLDLFDIVLEFKNKIAKLYNDASNFYNLNKSWFETLLIKLSQICQNILQIKNTNDKQLKQECLSHINSIILSIKRMLIKINKEKTEYPFNHNLNWVDEIIKELHKFLVYLEQNIDIIEVFIENEGKIPEQDLRSTEVTPEDYYAL